MGIILTLAISSAAAHSEADTPKTPGQTLTIKYLANEGVFLSDGKVGVLIDSLFRDGVAGYQRLEPETLEKLETVAAPFDQVRLVLVTHKHRDHFNAESVSRHMTANPEAKLVTSTQVAEVIQATNEDFDAIQGRVKAITPAHDELITVEHAGIKVELFRVSHGSGRFAGVENLGYIVTIGGQRVLHIGDAELGDGAFEPVKRFAKDIDVALLPYWWMGSRSGRACIAEALPNAHLVAFHIESGKAVQIAEKIKKNLPAATVFTTPSQSFSR